MDESSSLVSLCQRTAVSLKVFAVSPDVLHHAVLSRQLVVGREMTYHSVGGREGGKEGTSRERYI